MTGSPRAPARAAPGAGPVTVTGLAQRSAWRAREFPPVEQVTPGTFRWTTPSGRSSTTEPTRYPI